MKPAGQDPDVAAPLAVEPPAEAVLLAAEGAEAVAVVFDTGADWLYCSGPLTEPKSPEPLFRTMFEPVPACCTAAFSFVAGAESPVAGAEELFDGVQGDPLLPAARAKTM